MVFKVKTMRRGFDLSGKTILFFWMIIGVVVVAEAQVGIGTKTPDESAQLEVTVPENQVTKRGVLIPRVALVSTNSMDPMENSGDLPNSLLVFNTATVGDVTPGFYYWYDGNWEALSSESGAMVTNVSLTTDGSMLILTDSRGEQVDIPLSDISYTPISETAPVPGAAGDTYFNTSEGIIYISNGSNWIAGSNGSVVTVEDNLTSSSTTNALSANQGRILNEQSASKLDSSLVSGHVFVGNADGKAVGVALSGDATIDNTGALTIGDDAVTNSKLADNAVNTSEIVDDAVTTSKLIDGAVTAAKLNQMGATDGQVIKWNNTSSVWEATNDNEVTVEDNLTSSSTTNALSANQGRILNEQSASKLDSSLVSGNIFVGNADGKAAGVALSGDATIDNTGALTIGDDAVTNSKLADNAVNTAEIVDDAVTTDKIADNSVDGTKIQVLNNVEGSMLYYNGTDWVIIQNGTAGQVLRMNDTGTAPEWVTSKRVGEFVYAKSGRTVADGYLAVMQGTVPNGAIDYPVWAAQYPEFVSGNDIVFPSDVEGMFLRNIGGNAGSEGNFQDDATARPNSDFTTNTTGSHNHSATGQYNKALRFNNNNDTSAAQDNSGANEPDVRTYGTITISSNGSHAHSVTGGGDTETRPRNRAYQLYTIVDTY